MWCNVQKKETVPLSHNVRFTRSSINTIIDNADRITETAKSGTTVLV